MIEPSQAKSRISSSLRGQRPGLRPLLSALLALSGCLAFSGQAGAQVDADVNHPPPNVLLLVDTSGSMEYKSTVNSFPACKYDATGVIPSGPTNSEKSRWIDLVEVLTGTITNY